MQFERPQIQLINNGHFSKNQRKDVIRGIIAQGCYPKLDF